MADVPGASAELAAIHAEFAEPMLYTGAGLNGETIQAVAIETEAADFLGPGRSLRVLVFEVLFAALPLPPSTGDLLVDAGETCWRVIEFTRRGDIEAWHLAVELV